VTTEPEVAASFLLITYVRPTATGLSGGAPWRGGVKGFAAPLSTTFNLRGHAVIRCSRLLHHMHLLVPTWHSRVVWFVLPHFPQGSAEPAGWLLGGVGEGFFWFTLSLGVPHANPFLFWLIRFRASTLSSLAPPQRVAHITLGKSRLIAQLTNFECRRPNPLQTFLSLTFQMTQIQGQT